MTPAAIRAVTSSKFQDWGTPRAFFLWLHLAFRFTVDVCALPWNAKLPRFWSPRDNALEKDWRCEIWFSNPQYILVEEFTEKGELSVREGASGVFLLAERPDTRWFRKLTEQGKGRLRRSWFNPRTRVLWLCWQEMTVGIYRHDQRIPFEGPSGAGSTFPSVVVMLEPPLGAPRIHPAGLRPPPHTEQGRAAAMLRLMKSLPKKYRSDVILNRPLLTEGRPSLRRAA